MKKKLLRIFLFIMTLLSCIVPSENNGPRRVEALYHSGGCIYFDNTKSNWNYTNFYLCIGHNSYTSLFKMSKISNTNLYYTNSLGSWSDANYCAVMATNDSWNGGNFGYDSMKNNNSVMVTGKNTSYEFSSNNTHIITSSGSSKGSSISISYNSGTSLNIINKTHTISSENTNKGTVTASGYKLSSLSASSASSISNSKIEAAITSTISMTASPKDGYSFDGWYTGNSKVSSSATYTTSCYSATTFTAKFTPHTYSIEFDKNNNNATGSMLNLDMTYGTSKDLTANTFSYTGYTFSNWNTEPDGSGKSYTDKQSVSNLTSIDDGNVKLYAQWSPISYTISYNANGGTGTMQDTTTSYDKSFNLTKNSFLKEGYSFSKWNTKSDGSGTSYSDSATNLSNLTTINNTKITLYAQWEPNTYTISFDVNGGNESYSDTTVTFDSTYEGRLPTTNPTHPNEKYVFAGWYIGDELIESNSVVKITSNTTLKAVWAENIAVTFNPNTGSWEEGTQTTKYYYKDKTYGFGNRTFPSTENLSKTGYSFVGWFDSRVGGNEITLDTILISNEDHTLYAHWSNNTYNIEFNGNESTSGSTSSMSDIFYDKDTTLVANGFKKTGYIFAGWSTSKNGDIIAIDQGSVKNLTSDDKGTVILYAQWTPINYKIKYDANGGEGSMDDSSATYDLDATLTANAFKKEGYNFVGWSTSINGDIIAIDQGSVKNLTSEDKGTVTLYAQWAPITYTITLHKNFGGSTETNVINNAKYDISYGSDSIFNNNGYELIGWSTSPKGDIVYNPSEIKNATSKDGVTVDLYAQWKIKTYNISYSLNGGNWNNQTNPNPLTYTLATSLFTISSPTYGSSTFNGWTCEELGITEPTVNLVINPNEIETYSDITLIANWSASITIYVDAKAFADKLGSNNNLHYTSFKIHYWKENGNGTDWDSKPSFTHTGKDNIYSVTINFDNTITQVDYIIIVFTRNENGGKDDPTQSTSIETGGWTAENNGEEYFIALPSGGFSWVSDNDWSISNLSLVEAPRVAYYDDPNEDPVYLSSYSKNHNIQFVEKEGYRLEGWYTSPTDFSEKNRFTSQTNITYTNNRFNVYAHYVEAHDYYMYVEIKNSDWKDLSNMHVYKWNSYFENHNNLWPGVTSDIQYLGNGIYRIYVDASKSYDKLILVEPSTLRTYENSTTTYMAQTVDIDMTPTMSYYIISNETIKDTTEGSNTHGQQLNKVYYEKTLDNDIYAQKNSSNTNINEFRFTAGLQAYEDLVDIPENTVGKEFGYKFIFIKDDECYVGYWNFTTNTMMDCIRYEGELLEASKEGYKGYYSLTLTDDINFKYSNYNQIIVVACYRDNAGNTQIIKAQEFNIVGTGTNVHLYKIER